MERILNEKIPFDIVQILGCCGFENELSISSITSDTINEIEDYVNEDLSILNNTSYEGVSHFKLKPGHKCAILNLPNHVHRSKESNSDGSDQCKMSDFSYILRTFIETAETNFGKHPKGFRYNETCRHFATLIYLMCGRACYEALCANLPIPQPSTIRKFNSFHSVPLIKYYLNVFYILSGLHRSE